MFFLHIFLKVALEYVFGSWGGVWFGLVGKLFSLEKDLV